MAHRGTFLHRDRPVVLIVDPEITANEWEPVWKQDLAAVLNDVVQADLDTEVLVERSIEVARRHGFDMRQLPDDPNEPGVRLGLSRRRPAADKP